MLRFIYGWLLRWPLTATYIRLLWGRIRQKLFGADPYWDMIDVMRERNIKTFLDVGMHHGMYTDIILKKIPGASILGFEPTPVSFFGLVKKYTGISNVAIINCALGDRDGLARLYCNNNEQTNSLLAPGSDSSLMGGMMTVESEVEVALKRLDTIAKERSIVGPLFAKIDVQGAEAAVIRGGSSIFSESVAGCLMEIQLRDIYQGQGCLRDIHSMVEALGFEIRQVYPAMVMHGVAVQLEILFVKKSS